MDPIFLIYPAGLFLVNGVIYGKCTVYGKVQQRIARFSVFFFFFFLNYVIHLNVIKKRKGKNMLLIHYLHINSYSNKQWPRSWTEHVFFCFFSFFFLSFFLFFFFFSFLPHTQLTGS